jgi:2-C-methyl-D-erythritol 2,4-cyclodiphosphate synthase
MRVGHGYDVHQLVEDRKLILGGVEIEHTLGLLGHSDADVLCHAISDALLGAAALGDIGKYFPDTDPQYKGASSTTLMKNVVELLNNRGYGISNIDSTLILQKPKVAPFIDKMRLNIARACGLDVDQVSVKATTTEKLGFPGREEGVAAHAVVLIEKKRTE